MSKSLNTLARVAAYGAIPAFLYLIMVVAVGAGASREMLFPVAYIWVIAGVLINGWVERRKAERNK